jgi:hypothetical protein
MLIEDQVTKQNALLWQSPRIENVFKWLFSGFLVKFSLEKS